ncbi:MAG: AMP-binding protein [Solirubrobacteraceae bacterium]
MIRSPFPDVEIPDKPLTEFVLARAAEFGDAPALIDAPSGRAITYAQLRESMSAVAAGLAERGFGNGEVFAYYAPNCPAPYKKVRAVEIIDEIPKAPSGKILRRVLVERERTAAVAG